jgi:hypothetical protein
LRLISASSSWHFAFRFMAFIAFFGCAFMAFIAFFGCAFMAFIAFIGAFAALAAFIAFMASGGPPLPWLLSLSDRTFLLPWPKMAAG